MIWTAITLIAWFAVLPWLSIPQLYLGLGLVGGVFAWELSKR
jgi:hypothetical protein